MWDDFKNVNENFICHLIGNMVGGGPNQKIHPAKVIFFGLQETLLTSNIFRIVIICF